MPAEMAIAREGPALPHSHRPKRTEITTGEHTLAKIAAHNGASKSALRRHRNAHLPRETAKSA